MPIRVLIADDHTVFRAGLREALARVGDIEVVGEAGTGKTAVTQALALQPDVAVMDLQMPDGGGIDAAMKISEVSPRTRVLVLTALDDVETFHRAIAAGVAGFLLKGVTLEHLAASIRGVYRGETVVHPELMRHLLRVAPSQPDDAAGKSLGLSRREVQILRDVARGLTDKEIAARLWLSEATIQSQLRDVYQKLGVRSRAQAVRRAVHIGLISPSVT